MKPLFSIFFVVAAIQFLTMPRSVYIGDPSAPREEARSFILTGHLEVSPEIAHGIGDPGQYFAENKRTGQWFSKYGILNTLLNVPPLALEYFTTHQLPEWDSKTRGFCLNLFNILWSVLICCLLFKIAGLYCNETKKCILFVFTSMYCTFLWNYLRSQTSEIYQVLFFLGFYYFAALYFRSQARGNLIKAWIFLTALVLTKVSFLLLVPIFIAVLIWHTKDSRSQLTKCLLQSSIPLLSMFGALSLVNQLKFGSPFLTGYHQWKWESHLPTLTSFYGIWDFLFGFQRSIFFHYPLLIFSIWGWKEFLKRHPKDSALILSVALTNIIWIGLMPTWNGEACYGPRYLLFFLPVLALPVLSLSKKMFAPVLIILATSFCLQVAFNSLDPFTYYFINQPKTSVKGPHQIAFFKQPLSLVHLELILHRHNLEALPYLKELNTQMDQRAYTEYVLNLNKWTTGFNYLLF